MDETNHQIMNYIKTHWPSQIKPEWTIPEEKYPEILKKTLKDLTKKATKGKQFFRLAGQSGTGKTTQLLPAIEAHFTNQQKHPILLAARILASYHPHAAAIKATYGPENFRQKTDAFTTILMFLTLKTLIQQGYDIILDLTLLDPIIESTLMQMLQTESYQTRLTITALSKEISDQHIAKRTSRQVAKSTATEFWRATHLSLAYYAQHHPRIPITIWNAWDLQPIYDGPIGDPKALQIIKKYQQITKLPPKTPDEATLRQAKITHFTEKRK